jgi:hypothetical protein
MRILFSILLGVLFACLINYYVVQRLIIPDPCYYHIEPTTKLFDLFYSLESADGGHPFPTIFNFLFTIVIGALGGFWYTKWRRSVRPKSTTFIG